MRKPDLTKAKSAGDPPVAKEEKKRCVMLGREPFQIIPCHPEVSVGFIEGFCCGVLLSLFQTASIADRYFWAEEIGWSMAFALEPCFFFLAVWLIFP